MGKIVMVAENHGVEYYKLNFPQDSMSFGAAPGLHGNTPKHKSLADSPVSEHQIPDALEVLRKLMTTDDYPDNSQDLGENGLEEHQTARIDLLDNFDSN